MNFRVEIYVHTYEEEVMNLYPQVTTLVQVFKLKSYQPIIWQTNY